MTLYSVDSNPNIRIQIKNVSRVKVVEEVDEVRLYIDSEGKKKFSDKGNILFLPVSFNTLSAFLQNGHFITSVRRTSLPML